MKNVIDLVIEERINQNEKWGEQNHNDLKWLSILGEEFGEVAEMVNEDNPSFNRVYPHKEAQEAIEHELIQVAAVCVAWVECIRRRTNVHKEQK